MTITRLKRSQSLQSFNFQTNLMKKIILLALVGTGFIVNMPFTAQALDSEKIGHNLDREPDMSIAQYDRSVRSRSWRSISWQPISLSLSWQPISRSAVCGLLPQPWRSEMDLWEYSLQSSRCPTCCQATGAAWLSNPNFRIEPFQTMSCQHLNPTCGLPTDWSDVVI